MAVRAAAFLFLALAATSVGADADTGPADIDAKAGNATKTALKMLSDDVNAQLHAKHFQWVNAIVALVLGLVMCFNGEFAFKYIMVACAGIFSFTMAMTVITADYPHLAIYIRVSAAVEIAVVCSFVAFKGFMGFRLAMGMALGGVLAFYIHLLAHNKLHDEVADHWAFLFIGGNVCLLAGLYPFIDVGKGHHRLMALTWSFFGSALVVSACSFFLTLLAQKTMQGFFQDHFKYEVPEGEIYLVDFLSAIIWSGSKAVGLFVNSPSKVNTAKFFGMKWGLDRIFARVWWFVLFMAGTMVQIKIDKRRDRKAADMKAQSAKLSGSKKKADGWLGSWKKNKEDNSKTKPLLR